jgi:hypothetical protein
MQSFYKSTLNAFCDILKESTQKVLTQETVSIYNTDHAKNNYMADQHKTVDQLTDEDYEAINTLDASEWEDASSFLKELDKQADAFIIFGSMGLWDGNHEIIPEKETGLMVILDKLIDGKDSIDISLVDGHIEFTGGHHDGSNSYNIYGITQEGEEIFELCWEQDDMEELALHPEFEEITDLSKRDQQKKFWEIFMDPENEFVVKLKQ